MYQYCLGPNIRAYQKGTALNFADTYPYSFSSPDMARNLVNDMTMYLYNTNQTTQNVTSNWGQATEPIKQYSNPRAAELHIDKLIQNVLRADRQLVQGDIVRKLPVMESYAADYYGD